MPVSFTPKHATVLGIALAFLLAPVPATADHDPCISLLEASFLDEVQDVRDLLAQGTDVDCRDQDRQTPLMIAAEGGSLASLRVLLKHGARTDLRDVFGHRAVDRAIAKLPMYAKPRAANLRLVYENVVRLLKRAGDGNAR